MERLRKMGKRKCLRLKVHLNYEDDYITMYEENEENEWVIYYDGKYQKKPFFTIDKKGVQTTLQIPFINMKKV